MELYGQGRARQSHSTRKSYTTVRTLGSYGSLPCLLAVAKLHVARMHCPYQLQYSPVLLCCTRHLLLYCMYM